MGIDRIRLDKGQWTEITDHLRASLPEEACGLLAGRNDRVERVIPVENIEHSAVHYHMEHHGLIAAFFRMEAEGLELLGVFHSHPSGPSGVSQSDVREWQYPEAALVVCTPVGGEWEGRAFTVGALGVTEMPIEIE